MELPLTSYSTNEAAIHRLVDDILADIFLLNATLPDLACREATTVACSQVCMRWRSIALRSPTIWGPIIDYSRHSFKWIETLLDRSHPSLLDFGNQINTVDWVYGRRDVLELVFNHSDRLRIFNLKISASSWELVCSRFLQLPAPNLEFVKVFTLEPLQLTHPLFDHNAPNLRNLQLHLCTINFTSPIFTTLTELYVHDITKASYIQVPTVLDWLNILGGMPALRWVTLYHAISSATTNAIYPIIHLAALDMLSVAGAFHESVTLIEHLITPPRCGLRLRCYDARVGLDQRKLWTIIENKMGSWAKNAPNRYLEAWSTQDVVAIGNLHYGPGIVWGTEAEVIHDKQHIHRLDPVMNITLRLSNSQDCVPLFLSLFAFFERTFFDTTFLELWIDYEADDGPEVFLPLVDSFRGFVNLKVLGLGFGSLLLSLLQHSLPNSAFLLPALRSLQFCNVLFLQSPNLVPRVAEFLLELRDQLPRVAEFLRWREEQGFPVEKINILKSCVNRQYVLTHLHPTVVEIDDDTLCY